MVFCADRLVLCVKGFRQKCLKGSRWLQWLQKLFTMALNPLETVGTVPNKLYTFNYLGKVF